MYFLPMPGLTARLKRLRDKNDASTPVLREPPGAATRGSRLHVKCSTTSLGISLPLAVTVSSTFGVENQVFLPRHCTIQSRDEEISDGSAFDFDVAYFYGDSNHTVSTTRDTDSFRSSRAKFVTDRSDKQVLVPLLAAHWCIQRRAEGFKTQGSDQSPAATPRPHLITLQDALARDDIRRRDEGFELALEMQTPRYRCATPFTPCVPGHGEITGLPTREGGPRLSSDIPTIPSAYSSGSWEEKLPIISDTISSPIDAQGLVIGGEAEASDTEGILDDHSSSSIDETSFMRMAAPLGW
ncbi:uncharacterized protein C8Q71DRAFT_308068 [Rhodofomes roseus]|uniref:Uncharacterized protein n=1 Tax=Rhodofomes roseus TaxID=34475 RepID=A0ABQ8K2T2_9APHY|nr:uncharacterized protein C8Q71DRAFT_308068 [Rhodofomes roseus]KAH9831165.1 hypothetical protein C8Q71DRAFT_308068 [Rhodofomes roseus]